MKQKYSFTLFCYSQIRFKLKREHFWINICSSYFGMKVSCDPGQLNYLELFTSSHLESFLRFSDSVTALVCFSLSPSHFLSRLECNQQPESRPFPLWCSSGFTHNWIKKWQVQRIWAYLSILIHMYIFQFVYV